MRKFILSTLAATAFAISVLAQSPQGFKYQAVIRDAAGNILNNQAVGMQMTIQQGSIGGTTIYQETVFESLMVSYLRKWHSDCTESMLEE